MDRQQIKDALAEVAELPINPDDAWQTAIMYRRESNVARCYLKLLLARPEEQPVSDLVLDFARGIVGADGFYTQAAVTVARELLRISGREPQKEPE